MVRTSCCYFCVLSACVPLWLYSLAWSGEHTTFDILLIFSAPTSSTTHPSFSHSFPRTSCRSRSKRACRCHHQHSCCVSRVVRLLLLAGCVGVRRGAHLLHLLVRGMAACFRVVAPALCGPHFTLTRRSPTTTLTKTQHVVCTLRAPRFSVRRGVPAATCRNSARPAAPPRLPRSNAALKPMCRRTSRPHRQPLCFKTLFAPFAACSAVPA